VKEWGYNVNVRSVSVYTGKQDFTNSVTGAIIISSSTSEPRYNVEIAQIATDHSFPGF
jgi:3-hydroxyisobutyrate dehydrogenase-like beta-hydroxyacid dehydrogenase